MQCEGRLLPPHRLRADRLAAKEKRLVEKQCAGKLKNYNVMKNVSTHSMISSVDGECRNFKIGKKWRFTVRRNKEKILFSSGVSKFNSTFNAV